MSKKRLSPRRLVLSDNLFSLVLSDFFPPHNTEQVKVVIALILSDFLELQVKSID